MDGLMPYPALKATNDLHIEDIPDHWNILPLCAIAKPKAISNQCGRELLSVYLNHGVVPFRSVKEKRTNATSEDLSNYQAVDPGDFVLNNQQAWRGSVGVSMHQGIVSPAYLVLSLGPRINPKYANLLFRERSMVAQYLIASKGVGSIQRNLYWPHLKRIPITLPPLPEQAAIVRFLDHADRKIRRYIRAKQKLIKLLEEQKQAIIHRAVTRGLNPNVPLKDSGISWLGEIPGHWETWRISRFATVGNGSTPSRGESKYWSSSDYPWLNSSQINRGLIDSADQFVSMLALNECHLPKVTPGSILVAITGQGRTRGKSAILAIEATINQHIAYLSLRLQIASPEFVSLVLTAAYTHLRSISDDSGSTKGALTCEDLKRLKIPVPPHEEQRALLASTHSATTETINAISRLESEIGLLSEYRTRLIADVVTGKLDVREAAAQLPDDEQDTHRLDELDEISDPEEDALDDLVESPEEPEP